MTCDKPMRHGWVHGRVKDTFEFCTFVDTVVLCEYKKYYEHVLNFSIYFLFRFFLSRDAAPRRAGGPAADTLYSLVRLEEHSKQHLKFVGIRICPTRSPRSHDPESARP